MFKHVFLTRIKYYTRSKAFVFWLLLFPIILSTLFKVALSSALDVDKYEAVKIAVVNDTAYEEMEAFDKVLQSVSAKDSSEVNDDTMFIAEYVDIDAAEKLLKDEDIAAYIFVDDKQLKIKILENGVDQTIVQQFVEIATQRIATITEVYTVNQGVVSDEFLSMQEETKTYVQSLRKGDDDADPVAPYYYTVLAMACMYGMMVGIYDIIDVQANLSARAMRTAVAPVNKIKLFLAHYTSGCVVQTFILFVIFIYMKFVLQVEFGNRYPLIILTTVVGSVMGVSLGSLLSSLIKLSESMKTGLCIGFSMLCCFLAGMMDSGIKYDLMVNAPIVNKINPATLITDAYYRLYYYEGLSGFFENISIMLFITVIAIIGTILVLRRQKYDNI